MNLWDQPQQIEGIIGTLSHLLDIDLKSIIQHTDTYRLTLHHHRLQHLSTLSEQNLPKISSGRRNTYLSGIKSVADKTHAEDIVTLRHL